MSFSGTDKIYIVCLFYSQRHHPDSIKRRCDICFKDVCCMPFNLIKIPLCMSCAGELRDAEYSIDKENIEAAVEFLKKTKKV